MERRVACFKCNTPRPGPLPSERTAALRPSETYTSLHSEYHLERHLDTTYRRSTAALSSYDKRYPAASGADPPYDRLAERGYLPIEERYDRLTERRRILPDDTYTAVSSDMYPRDPYIRATARTPTGKVM